MRKLKEKYERTGELKVEKIRKQFGKDQEKLKIDKRQKTPMIAGIIRKFKNQLKN